MISNPSTALPLLATAGDVLESYSDAEVFTDLTSPTKLKEIRLARGGKYRIKVDLKCSNNDPGYNSHARIYRNGVAVGVDNYTQSASWQTYSEDIDGWATGDLCQVYGTDNSATYVSNCRVRNFRIYSDVRIDHEVIT